MTAPFTPCLPSGPEGWKAAMKICLEQLLSQCEMILQLKTSFMTRQLHSGMEYSMFKEQFRMTSGIQEFPSRPVEASLDEENSGEHGPPLTLGVSVSRLPPFSLRVVVVTTLAFTRSVEGLLERWWNASHLLLSYKRLLLSFSATEEMRGRKNNGVIPNCGLPPAAERSRQPPQIKHASIATVKTVLFYMQNPITSP